MRQLLTDAGFTEVKIEVKENAADIIKDWIPGSGAEKYITSAYVTAVKPVGTAGLRDNVRADVHRADAAALAGVKPGGAAAGCCPPSAGA
mmetsp:Transcript_51155/g.158634  ORF Transcript_51155/g.158634 Transcript_51155/m.158634 type:complete len:90 (+) Transcript_51155:522-791(+)